MTTKSLVQIQPNDNLHKLLLLGPKPDMDKLRRLCLDETLVVGASQLMPVSVIGEGAFGVVWKCALHPVDKAPQSRVEAGGVVAVSLADSLGARRVHEVARSTFPSSLGATAAAAAAAPSAAAPKLYTGPAQFVALKRIKLSGLNTVDTSDAHAKEVARMVSAFSAELIALKSLSHPNVISYIGAVVYEVAEDEELSGSSAGSDATAYEQLALLQEFAPYGTLGKIFQQAQAPALRLAFSTGDGLRWAHHVAQGLDYLHSCKPPIIHRDLKPDNVLLCLPNATAKLADFGLSTFDLSAAAWAGSTSAGRTAGALASIKPTGCVGAMRYMAPENYRGEAYTYKTDVYSFSLILYELLARSRAYKGLFLLGEQIAGLAASAKVLRPTLPAKWPEEAKALLSACWHADPAQRPDFAAIVAELEKWRSDSSDRVLRALWRGAHCVPMAERATALVKGGQAHFEPRWNKKLVPAGGELDPGKTTVISARRSHAQPQSTHCHDRVAPAPRGII